MTTINGSIAQVPAITTHTDPANKTVSGSFSGGEVVIGRYTNTGNVDQTITFNNISNATNCSLASSNNIFWNASSGPSVTTNAVVVPVGSWRELVLVINVPTQAPGAPVQTFSFDVNTTWS